MNQETINTYRNLLLFLLLVIFFYSAWQYLITSYLRQKLFEFRDKIFLIATDGLFRIWFRRISDNKRIFEWTIRFAHDLTWFSFIFYTVPPVSDINDKKEKLSVINAIAKIKDNKLQSELNEGMNDLVVTILVSMYFRSIFLLIISLIFIPILLLIRAFKVLNLKDRFKLQFRKSCMIIDATFRNK